MSQAKVETAREMLVLFPALGVGARRRDGASDAAVARNPLQFIFQKPEAAASCNGRFSWGRGGEAGRSEESHTTKSRAAGAAARQLGLQDATPLGAA